MSERFECGVCMAPIIENGLLSYENPNYHLDPARLDAAIYGELYDSRPRRLIQASNDLEADDGDAKDADTYDDDLEDDYSDNRRRECMEEDEPLLMRTNPISISDKESLLTPPNQQPLAAGDESPPPEKERADQQASEKAQGLASVPHVAEGPNNDLYAVPVKLRPKKDIGEKVENAARELPPGWEKHEDNDGPYYWHIKSGTIQREMPETPPQEIAKDNGRKDMVRDSSNLSEISKFDSANNVMTSSVTRSTTSSCLDADRDDRKRKEELAFKRRSYPVKPEPECGRAVRFFVRSLGWVEIAESDLTPERSSRAVNKCIVDLSLGRNDLLDVVGRWGDGKDLFMDLDDGALKLMDPENLTTLHTQPIHTIRVWGVGRDNGRERDFAYVARDRATRRHMCHVFRCDMPARTIANTLRDICKRIMIERSLAQVTPSSRPARPTDLPTRQRHSHVQSFPTPMEEPRKVVRAQYLGSASVGRATGMDILNAAIARLASPSPGETSQRRNVSVAVAPSMISITAEGETSPLTECRVRYLSFLGIGRDVRHCAFIMHTAQDQFVAHVFQCEPSSGALCKTIEAACKLRYQKCLDAHPGSTMNGGLTAGSTTTISQGSSMGLASGGSGELRSPGGSTRVGIGATLKSFVGSLAAAASRRPS